MQPYFTLISKTRYFLLPWLVFIALAGIVLSTFSAAEIHLAINGKNNGFLDWLMPWVTLGADGWTIVVACLLMVAWHRRAGLFIGIACFFASSITWVLKSTLFYGTPRPKWYFTNVEKFDLHYVPGVENWLYDSFPSGHTTVAFAFFFSIALCVKQTKLPLLFFFVALAVGYSRIYLSQHFLLDVFFGSIIGTVGTLIVFAEATRFNLLSVPVKRSENK